MSRDNIVFATCGLLLGLIIGSFLIGPRLAPKAASVDAPAVGEAPPSTPSTPGAATSTPAMGGGNAQTMSAVREQLASLKAAVERDPKNYEALQQLGNMYMDAAKFPQAVEYYERALAVHEDPAIRTDLGICYKQAGQLDKAVDAFRRVSEEAPDQWQALFNEAIVLGELKRFDEARAVAARLKQMRPDDPQVQKLATALAGKS